MDMGGPAVVDLDFQRHPIKCASKVRAWQESMGLWDGWREGNRLVIGID